jgi:hypothetical protein
MRSGVASPWKGLGSREATTPYVLAEEARCWLLLRPDKAVTTFEAAGEPEPAAHEGIAALDIAQDTKSDVTMRELKRLDERLAVCDVPAAADFREQFATL